MLHSDGLARDQATRSALWAGAHRVVAPCLARQSRRTRAHPTAVSRFNAVGAGTKEIRIKDSQGIYRVMYVAKFEEAVYVLHCFQKKTQTTTQHDKDIAEARYRAVVRERKVKK